MAKQSLSVSGIDALAGQVGISATFKPVNPNAPVPAQPRVINAGDPAELAAYAIPEDTSALGHQAVIVDPASPDIVQQRRQSQGPSQRMGGSGASAVLESVDPVCQLQAAMRSGLVGGRASVLAILARGLPMNEFGLPEFFYSPDMLDTEALIHALDPSRKPTSDSQITDEVSTPEEQLALPFMMDDISGALPEASDTNTHLLRASPDSQIDVSTCADPYALLSCAVVMLSYDEGFAALHNGQPWWGQLPCEPADAYVAFETYAELQGIRRFQKVAEIDERLTLQQVEEWSSMYYWPLRVRALDLYMQANHQKLRLQRAQGTEESHYQLASRTIKRLVQYLDNVALNDETLLPEDAVKMIEKLVKIERISVGLPANGESKENFTPRAPQSVQVLMQQISQNASDNQNAQEHSGITLDAMLLDDPDAVDSAQRLILRMQGGQA